MKYFVFVLAVVFGLELQAGECKNGQCAVRKGTVQTVRNVTRGTIRTVTPPYKARHCVNGKCFIK